MHQRDLYSSIFANTVEPIYDIVRGTSRRKYRNQLDKTQWLSREEIQKIQMHNLREVLNHAYESVPFYRRIFKERGLVPSQIKEINDLVKLPILRKQDINDNFNDLTSSSFQSNNLIPYQSGGSGEPIRFFITKEKISWEIAAEYRAYEWAGYTRGDRCFLLWASPYDLTKERNLVSSLTKKMERLVICNSWLLSDEALGGFAEKAIKFNPEIVKGYSNAIYMLAKYCQEKNIRSIRPKAVITSAEKLLDSRRKLIEEVFQTRVFDHYGSREIGAIASECEEHNGCHISAENVVVEFVKDGEHVADGEEGAIVITSLRNFGMPFIRYQIGDVGKSSSETCNCGRGLPMISSVEGRLSDFLAVYDKKTKRIVPYLVGEPGFVGLLLMHYPVNSYRVIQESLESVRVQLVKGKNYSEDDTHNIDKALKGYLGDDIKIELEFLDSIPPLPSGKRSQFTSKINAWT